MKISLFLMIILTFFKSYKAEEDYPIEIFLNLIQNTEIYNIINAIKCIFGDDIAISFCLEAEDNNKSCELLVSVYMECPKINNMNLDQLIELIFENKDSKKILDILYQLLLKYEKKIPEKDLNKYLQNAIEKISISIKEQKIKSIN